MFFETNDKIFIDETKAKTFIMAVSAVPAHRVRDVEKSLRVLLLPGQKRIHFRTESDRRRKLILAAFRELDVRVSVWKMSGKPDKNSRDACLAAITSESILCGVVSIVLEREDSQMSQDRTLISGLLRQAKMSDSITFEHVAPQNHPILWLSDAVAWCQARGPEWRKRTDALTDGRIRVLRKT